MAEKVKSAEEFAHDFAGAGHLQTFQNRGEIEGLRVATGKLAQAIRERDDERNLLDWNRADRLRTTLSALQALTERQLRLCLDEKPHNHADLRRLRQACEELQGLHDAILTTAARPSPPVPEDAEPMSKSRMKRLAIQRAAAKPEALIEDHAFLGQAGPDPYAGLCSYAGCGQLWVRHAR